MGINNDKKEQKKIVFKFPSDLFGKPKKDNDNTKLMKTIKQELKNKEDYKPELTVLEKYNKGFELLSLLSESKFKKAKELIGMGVNVNVKDEEGNTAIIYAAQNAPIEILKLLIENGAEINIRNHYGKTALIFATIFGEKEVLEFLINNGAEVNAPDYVGQTPLMYASENNDYEKIKILIEKGANANVVDMEGKNAWMYTLADSSIEFNEDKTKILKYLIEITESSKEQLFYGLVKSKSIEISKILLEYLTKKSPLENTIQKIIDLKLNGESINVQLIKILIEESELVNEMDSKGNTLLHAACERKDLNSIEYLIENGADITIKNHDGKTPYMLAFEKSDDETIEKIIEILNKNNQEELASELQEMLDHGFKIEYNNIELSDEDSYQSNSFEEDFVNRYNGRITDIDEALGEEK